MDVAIFRLINKFAGQYDWLDNFGIIFAHDLIFVLGILLLFLWLMDWGVQKTKNRFAVVMAIESMILAGGLIAPLLGLLWERKVPYVSISGVNLVAKFDISSLSFPSIYTALAFAIALPVLIYNKKAGFLLFLLAVIVGVFQVFVGTNYPSDVFVGFLISVFVVLFLNFFKSVFVAPVVSFLSRKK